MLLLIADDKKDANYISQRILYVSISSFLHKLWKLLIYWEYDI